MESSPPSLAAIEGSLLGTAVGDALGLPREGLSPQRAERLYGAEGLEHRMLWGRGLLSDDTEHSSMVGQALLVAGADPGRFGTSLAWRLRAWLLSCPAGVGFATLRALIKLCVGFSYRRSGVFSAGNGPAMRAPLVGVCLGDTPAMRELLSVSTRITHTDPAAFEGALAVALAAAAGREPAFSGDALLDRIAVEVQGAELLRALDLVREHLERGAEPRAFAEALGQPRGISGYVNHTVPAALYCYLLSPDDFALALERVVGLGGDSDTTGAILGGIAGARVGASGIPQPWVDGIRDWPRSVSWLRELALRLHRRFGEGASEGPSSPVPLAWPLIPARNALFLGIVLAHGFRRLLPPY